MNPGFGRSEVVIIYPANSYVFGIYYSHDQKTVMWDRVGKTMS